MITELKAEIESAAFMLASNEKRDKIHAKLLNCLVILNKLEEDKENSKPQPNEQKEVSKVARRLMMWSKSERQKQYNSKILNAYLVLSNNCQHKVSEQQLYKYLGSPTWFATNFTQMKTIADKNHGKIFEVAGDQVSIWPPVKQYIEEYQNHISQK